MPAPIPPGYTRGPLLFVGATVQPTMTTLHRQWIWREAGAYGARLLVVSVEEEAAEGVALLAADFRAWESDNVAVLIAPTRGAAMDPAHAVAVESATGIVLVGRDALRQSMTLGGTQLAQAIRRGHARGKLVAGIDAAAGYLCQHAIGPGPVTPPQTLRQAVSFAPGLGLVNRLAVDAGSLDAPLSASYEARLLAAVATNPFLVAVGLEPDSAVVLYSDETLVAAGSHQVTVIDGAEITRIDPNGKPDASAVDGELRFRLNPGDGFNLTRRTLIPAGDVDLPPTGPVTSVF